MYIVTRICYVSNHRCSHSTNNIKIHPFHNFPVVYQKFAIHVFDALRATPSELLDGNICSVQF